MPRTSAPLKHAPLHRVGVPLPVPTLPFSSPTPQEFDEAGWTEFTPHYIVWVCPFLYRDSDECRSQCIHGGRYCSPDPDGSIWEGYSGKDVVQVTPPQALSRFAPPHGLGGGRRPRSPPGSHWIAHDRRPLCQ